MIGPEMLAALVLAAAASGAPATVGPAEARDPGTVCVPSSLRGVGDRVPPRLHAPIPRPCGLVRYWRPDPDTEWAVRLRR